MRVLALIVVLFLSACAGGPGRGGTMHASLLERGVYISPVKNLSGFPLDRLEAGPFVQDNPDLRKAISDMTFDVIAALTTSTRALFESDQRALLTTPRQGSPELHLAITNWEQSRLTTDGSIWATAEAFLVVDGKVIARSQHAARHRVLEDRFEDGHYIPRYSTRFSTRMEEAFTRVAERIALDLIRGLEAGN